MKNLKVITIAITAIFLFLVSTNSQGQNFYITIGIGYGLNAASQSIDSIYSGTNSGTTSSSSSQNVKGSYGAGLNFGGAVGYMFSEHFGAEIGVSYLSGASITSSTNTNLVSVQTDAVNNNTKGTMLRIIPALKICGESHKITPYARIGLVLGVSPTITTTITDITTTTNYPYPTITDTLNQTNKFSGGVSIGFSVAVGADIKLSKTISIYGEVGMIAQTWAPTQSAYTTWTINGVDQLSTMATNLKQFNYVSSYTTTSSVPPNTALPGQLLQQYSPFSSWGFNVGLHFNFGNADQSVAPKK
jgi:hypothetical protein